jgi:tetratricopeptide (TPR) repeat protein
VIQSVQKRRGFLRELAGAVMGAIAAIVISCGSNRELSNGQERNFKMSVDSMTNAIEVDLNRNWNFGMENYKNRRYHDVPHFFWRVIEMDSSKAFVDVYSFLANAYAQLDKPDSALLVYQLGQRAAPDNPSLYRGMAHLYLAENQNAEAMAQYRRMVEMNVAEENDYRRLSELYLATRDTANAIEIFETLRALVPEDLQIRDKLSSLHTVRKNHQVADMRHLELQLQQNPKDPPTMLALGRVYYHSGEFTKCAATLEQYVALAPGDTYSREYLGEAYVEIGRYEEAISQLNVVLNENPEHAEALVLMARCYQQMQQWSAARRFAHRALDIDEAYGSAYLALGRIYEAAARHCQPPNALRFADKLVYKLAYQNYERALLHSASQTEARRQMKTLEPLLPRDDDYFANKNQDRPDGDCYEWIYE